MADEFFYSLVGRLQTVRAARCQDSGFISEDVADAVGVDSRTVNKRRIGTATRRDSVRRWCL